MPNLKTLIICDHKCKKKAVVVLRNPTQVRKITFCKKYSLSETDDIIVPHRLRNLKHIAYIEMDLEAVSVSWDKSASLKNIGIMQCLSTVRSCEELVCFNLTDGQMTEEDIESITTIIRNNTTLVIISLNKYYSSPTEHQKFRSCNASAAAMRQILVAIHNSRLWHLNMLNLSGNSIKKDAAEILAVVLAKCTVLEVLLLTSCDLHSEHLQRIGHSLKTICSLKYFDVSHNNLSEQSFATIASIITSNRNLRDLYIHGNCFNLHESLDKFWVALNCSNLTELSIDGDLLSVGTLCQLANFASSYCGLKRLLFSHPNLIEHVLINLPNCLETTKLVVAKYHSYLTIFGEGKETKTFHWSCTASSRILNLLCAFKKVTTLKLYAEKDHYTEEDINEITNVVTILTLLEEITVYGTTSCALLRLLHSMNEMRSLKEMCIFASNINDDVAGTLANILINNKEVNKLELWHCYLQTSQLAIIMSSLQTRVLKTLDLTSNYISDEAAENITGVILNGTTSVQYFSIGSNYLHTNGMVTLLNSLKSLSSLIAISLSCNQITESVAEDITDVIYNNPN